MSRVVQIIRQRGATGAPGGTAPIAANTLLGNASGSPAAPVAISASSARTLLGLAPIATSGSASDLSTGTVPAARLNGILRVYNVADYGGLSSATGATNLAAFEAATEAAFASGGGVVYVPPSATAYSINTKTWPDGTIGCVRLKQNVKLHIPEGATIQMASNQITGTTVGHVVIMAGADTAVFGTGTITGNTAGQSGYTGGYSQNGPACVLASQASPSHRGYIGGGSDGYLQLQDCFGNTINGGGTSGTKCNDFSVIGVISDNCGEGPQLEHCTRVTMGRIVSRDSNNVQVGDMVELASCQDVTVYDIYSESQPDPAGSGFDLFGCQRVSMTNIRTLNCNVAIHDFSPVSPCSDVNATDISVLYTSGGGSGGRGIHLLSQHATVSPKNIRVHGRVSNVGGALTYGVVLSQGQAVATYGGGPYDLDLVLEGMTQGIEVQRAPRLRGKLLIRNCTLYGFGNTGDGLAATDNVDWRLDLDIFNSSVSDFYQTGQKPRGTLLSSSFATVSGDLTGLQPGNHTPSVLIATATGGVIQNAFGLKEVRFEEANLYRLGRTLDGSIIDIYCPHAVNVVNAWPSGAARGIFSRVGPNVSVGDGNIAIPAGAVFRIQFNAALDAWVEIDAGPRTPTAHNHSASEITSGALEKARQHAQTAYLDAAATFNGAVSGTLFNANASTGFADVRLTHPTGKSFRWALANNDSLLLQRSSDKFVANSITAITVDPVDNVYITNELFSSAVTTRGAFNGVVIEDRDAATQSLLYSTGGAFRVFRSSVLGDVAYFGDTDAWVRQNMTVPGNLAVSGAANLGASVSTGIGVSTGDATFNLGQFRTGSGNAYIDIHASVGADFDARIRRISGVNGAFEIINAGTGPLSLIANEVRVTAPSFRVVASSGAKGVVLNHYVYDGLQFAVGSVGFAMQWDGTTYRTLSDGGSNGGCLIQGVDDGATFKFYTAPGSGTVDQTFTPAQLQDRMRFSLSHVAATFTVPVTSAFQSLSGPPSTLDIPTGMHRVVKNLANGEVRDWVNDGGVMKSSPAYT